MNKSRLDVTAGAAIAFALFYYLDDSGWFSAALPAILCHEWGHWIAVRACGGEICSLRLELSGLCMETTPFSDAKDEILSLISGPAAGLLWAAVSKCIGGEWGEKSAKAALAINIFNLLPALPLDGGRILWTVTGSEKLLRLSGGLISSGMIFLSAAFRLWGLLIPGLFLGKHVINP